MSFWKKHPGRALAATAAVAALGLAGVAGGGAFADESPMSGDETPMSGGEAPLSGEDVASQENLDSLQSIDSTDATSGEAVRTSPAARAGGSDAAPSQLDVATFCDAATRPEGVTMTGDGAVTIDLSGGEGKLSVVNPLNSYGGPALDACQRTVTSLDFIYSSGPGYTELEIGPNAFSQRVQTKPSNPWPGQITDDTTEISLTSVTFPEEGLTSLTIGNGAFQQDISNWADHADESLKLEQVIFPKRGLETLNIGELAFSQTPYVSSSTGLESGDCALATVQFPEEGLETLTLGNQAFAQGTSSWVNNQYYYSTGANKLKEVVFPEGLKTLSMDYKAFAQYRDSDYGKNALKFVGFPDGMESMSLAGQAFQVNSSPDDLLLFFAFNEGSIPEYVSLNARGTSSVQPVAEPGTMWAWTGPNGATTELWDNQFVTGGGKPGTDYEFDLNGVIAAIFDANGGELLGDAGPWYTFPAVDGDAQAGLYGDLSQLDPNGFRTDPREYKIKTLAAPAWDNAHAFYGWCTGGWSVDGDGVLSCGDGDPVAADTEITLDAAADGTVVISAGWVVTPEKPTLTEVDCDEEPQVEIPEVEGVEYTESRDGDVVTMTASPVGAGIGFAEGAETEWTFNVAPTPCAAILTVSYDLNGGTSDFDFADQTVAAGEEVTIPAQTPVREGYLFEGWLPKVVTRDANLIQPGAKYTVESNVTLVAQWKLDEAPVPPTGPTTPPTTGPTTPGAGAGSSGGLAVTGAEVGGIIAAAGALLLGGWVVTRINKKTASK